MKDTLTVGGLKRYVKIRKKCLRVGHTLACYADEGDVFVAREVLSDIVRPHHRGYTIPERIRVAESIIMSEEEAQ